MRGALLPLCRLAIGLSFCCAQIAKSSDLIRAMPLITRARDQLAAWLVRRFRNTGQCLLFRTPSTVDLASWQWFVREVLGADPGGRDLRRSSIPNAATFT